MLRPSLPLPMSPRKRADATSTYLRLPALALFLLAVATDHILYILVMHSPLRICPSAPRGRAGCSEEDGLLIACSEAMTGCKSFAVLSKRNPSYGLVRACTHNR